MRHRMLIRDLGVVLACKAAALLALYLLFFSPPHLVPSDPTAVGTALFGPARISPPERTAPWR